MDRWKFTEKFVFFFFQAEDGIRDVAVTGVQTCALPISSNTAALPAATASGARHDRTNRRPKNGQPARLASPAMDGMAKRSESLSRNCRLRLDLQFSDPQRWQPIYAGHVGHERLFARHGTESSCGARLRGVRFWARAGEGSPLGVRVLAARVRSEERRVGKECRSRWSPYH